MRRTWLLFSQAVTVAVAVLFVVQTLKPGWLGGALPFRPAMPLPVPTLSTAPALPRTPELAAAAGFSAAAELAAPAVVSIVASKLARTNPHLNDPRFRFFFGDRAPETQAQTGLGSGVLVAPEGYLLTNNHVIEGADEIEVQLADGRSAAASVIGTDPDTDLALLKISLERLPVVPLGDLRGLMVGDVVLAIGNPFNVGQTVTSGIVSALGRNQLGLSTFENFIQTDAAINPGNSGGALVDTHGRLVGINTAIFSRSGGSMGIGFAIPVDTARQVLDSLVRDGEVRRGFLGVEQRDLTAEFATSFGLPVSAGVLISGVLKDGPAAQAGLRPGDVVLEIDAAPVATSAQLLALVAALRPSSSTVVTVQRGGERLQLPVVVGQRPTRPRPDR
ncbi:MAG: trypsin-like peptidase domain-containing protein [Rubrivivax sp.]